MIDVKREIQYILVIRILENMALAGFLSAEELVTARRLAAERYRPENCLGNVLDISAEVW